MAEVGTFNDISRYIPGLTRYRYSMANPHRSQFGRGAQAQLKNHLINYYIEVHVTSPSNVADHCVLFALSDSSDADYQQQCSHQHTDLCDRCQSLQKLWQRLNESLARRLFRLRTRKTKRQLYSRLPSWPQSRFCRLPSCERVTPSRKKQETEVEQDHDPTDNTNESSSVFTCLRMGVLRSFKGCHLSKNTYL
ncbi:unnamed protein product [Pocillopora meandrina]|uniref:Uncharacterized protein n=1 Tax=Pocillopora meandrina TaxID=46732 RepID=A0AAU9XUZ1_9CNID|nr:unnamed protein product [Pocillopora meandrina]